MINISTISSTPRILLWDIETAKMLIEFKTYQLKQYSSYISPDAIKRDIWMPCAAWKWLGSNGIGSVSVLNDNKRFKEDYSDDYLVTEVLYNLISNADILIAHNGDVFDWKIFITRCLYHDFEPPQKPQMIDTLKIARKEFKFSSNSLRYLAKFLNVEDKGNSPDWDAVAIGDAEAIKYCAKYNMQDIRTLEGVYLKLRPYATSHVNLNAIISGIHHHTCPKCGHWDQECRGYRYTKAGKYQKYKCKTQTGGCGGWSKGKKNLKDVNLR